MTRIYAAVAACLCLGACATPYVGTPYDHASNNTIKSVGLAGNALPEKALAWEVASVGSNFGLVGALIDAGIQSDRANAVNEALVHDGFNAERELEGRIDKALATQGYAVKPMDVGARPKREFVAAYPAPKEPVDAYLDVVVQQYGYISAGAFKPFRPMLVAKVRLVSAKDPSKTLMENTITYNAMYPINGAITLSPNPDFAFKNRTELLADPKRLEQGIDDALYQTADTVARLMH
jgi:hypothetical protein